MPRARLGVALLIPPPLRAEIDTLRRAAGDGTLHRVPAHLTLVPPVNVRDDRIMDALDVLRAAAAATRPFSVRLGPPATFEPLTPVLYLPVDGPGLAAVYQLRDRVFSAPLARKLTWPFVPHVTLADEVPTPSLTAAVTALAGYNADVTFDRVHLLQEGSGRVWSAMADAAFAAPAVVGRGGWPLEISHTTEPDFEARAFADREWALHDAAELGADAVWTEDRFALTARRDGRIVGLADGWTARGVGFLSGLIVGAAERGTGVGSHLLAAFAALCADRDCPRLALRTLAGSRAHAFYMTKGWVEEAHFSSWVQGRDLVQLRRDL